MTFCTLLIPGLVPTIESHLVARLDGHGPTICMVIGTSVGVGVGDMTCVGVIEVKVDVPEPPLWDTVGKKLHALSSTSNPPSQMKIPKDGTFKNRRRYPSMLYI